MVKKNILMIFKKEIMYKPIIYRIVKDFDVVFNFLEAKIYPKQEGRIILEIRGQQDDIDKCIAYLKREEVQVEFLAEKIRRNEEICVHCGACTSVCTVDALTLDRKNMEVMFFPEKCIACGMCMKACPVKAMKGTSIDIELEEK